MDELKIEVGQSYSVSGTDSGFKVLEVKADGGLRVKWLDTENEVELKGGQVADFNKSGQLKLIPVGGEVVAEAAPVVETKAEEPVAEKKEIAAPETSERLRVKRIVRHIPTTKYVETMRWAIAMSPEEFAAAMGSRPVQEVK